MKHLLLTTIAAVMVGCGNPEADRALLDAAKKGNIETVKQHLADGADVNAKTESGWNPLHRAAIHGHKEIAEMLITKGADVNAKDNYDYTPLHKAALALDGSMEVVELLDTILIWSSVFIVVTAKKPVRSMRLFRGRITNLLRKLEKSFITTNRNFWKMEIDGRPF